MINDLKDLEKLLKLCRKQGVGEFEIDGIKMKLGDLPDSKQVEEGLVPGTRDPYAGFPTGILSPDQLAFYSVGGRPENDPELKGQDEDAG